MPPVSESAVDPEEFWRYLDELVAGLRIVIDRPKGSSHPRYPDTVYPLAYGYLEGTLTPDGGGIDVWIGSKPDRSIEALICTIDLVKKDLEAKLLLGCTPAESRQVLDFTNSAGMRAVLIERNKL